MTTIAPGGLPTSFAAEARGFTGDIDDFGPLEKEQKKAIRKGLKVMCRESQMGVAAAQRALADAGLARRRRRSRADRRRLRLRLHAHHARGIRRRHQPLPATRRRQVRLHAVGHRGHAAS